MRLPPKFGGVTPTSDILTLRVARSMKDWVFRLDGCLYPGVQKNWDDELFRDRVLQCLSDSSEVLDLGAGAGIVAAMNFRGVAKRVCGVDLDPRVVANPWLDEGKVADAGGIPYPDESFDVVFADNVIEHLAEPEAVFAEVRRVLRPGGRFLFKTPNRTHYMPLVASLTPLRVHAALNRLRGRASVDTFPTLYRANTRRKVQDLARRTGFIVSKVERFEGRPEYLRMWWPTYLLGAAYERIVNSTPLLASLRIVLFAELIRRD